MTRLILAVILACVLWAPRAEAQAPVCFLVTIENGDVQGDTNKLLNDIEAKVGLTTATDPVSGNSFSYWVVGGTTTPVGFFIGIAQGVPSAVRSTTKRLTSLYHHLEFSGPGAPSTHDAMLQQLKGQAGPSCSKILYLRPTDLVPAQTGNDLLALFTPL